MKRGMLLLAGIAALVLAAGCAASETPAAAQGKGAAVQSMQKSSVQTETAPPDRDQVRNAYDRAIDAAEWFHYGSMPCTGGVVSFGDGLYRKVSYAGIESMEDLKNYLRGIFSEELVNRLTTEPVDGEAPRFLEIKGKLYERQKTPEDKGGTGDIRVLVKKKSATRFEVDIQAELLSEDGKTVAGVKYNACYYEKQDGKWVFTNFELPGARG